MYQVRVMPVVRWAPFSQITDSELKPNIWPSWITITFFFRARHQKSTKNPLSYSLKMALGRKPKHVAIMMF